MNLKELDEFNLNDAVHFHDTLNPALFETDSDMMRPAVRKRLLTIAEDFIDHLGVNVKVEDITLSGSSAAYSYTKHSDIDVHILVDMSKFPDNEVYAELFHAKKTIYNETHDIKIFGYDVELYVQDSNEPVVSLGEYSIKNDKWIKLPRKRRANFDQNASQHKYNKLGHLIERALHTRNLEQLENLVSKLKKYRQAGLDAHGEFGPENLAYKALRTQGMIKKLYDTIDELHSEELSLPENNQLDEAFDNDYRLKWEKSDYGDIDAYAKLDDGNYLSIMFNKGYNDDNQEGYSVEFFRNNSQDVTGEGDAYRIFATVLSAIHSFTRKYKPNFIMFSANKEDDSGKPNESRASLYTKLVQRYAGTLGYTVDKSDQGNKITFNLKRASKVTEASGYIPSEKEKNDPRFKTALTVDVHPDSIKKNAKAFGFKVSRAGIPPLLRK